MKEKKERRMNEWKKERKKERSGIPEFLFFEAEHGGSVFSIQEKKV